MSEQKSYPRPRQVTTAGILGAVGGTLLVLSLFDSVRRLRTVEMRDAVQEFLAEPPGDGLGVTVGWVLDVLHAVMLANGALAAVATVLAVYLFWGHRGARIGFTMVAGVLVFTSPFSGGVLAVLLAVAAVMLWGRPAREWFAGRDPAQPAADDVFSAGRRREQPDPSWAPPPRRSEPAERQGRPWNDERPDDSAGSPHAEDAAVRPADRPPPAAHRFGEPVRRQWAPPTDQPADQPGPAPTASRHVDTSRRPGAVVAAALVTWALSSVVLFLFSVVVALLMAGQDVLLDEVAQDPSAATLDLSTTDVLALFWVISAILIFWCLCAIALALLALKRQNWARVALSVSCVMTVVVSAAVGVASMDLVVATACMVYVVAAGVTIAMLYTRRSNVWFTGPGSPRHDEPPYGGRGGQWAPPRVEQPQRPSGKPPVW